MREHIEYTSGQIVPLRHRVKAPCNRYTVAEAQDMYGFNYSGVTLDQIEAFTNSLNTHIAYVTEAGERLNVPEEQLEIHDWSKWAPSQFPAYAQKFHPGSSPVDAATVSDEFAAAWLDHIHKEPHHWQHWIFPDGYSPEGSTLEKGVMEMPERYAREMVADWMGASKAYTDSWDMTDWLKKNLPQLKLHSRTARLVSQILTEIGYQEDITYLI